MADTTTTAPTTPPSEPEATDVLNSPVAAGMAAASGALPASFVTPYTTEGGPCNPAKRSMLKVLNTSTWWINKHEASGFALQYHKASMAGAMAIDKMRAKRAAKGDENTDPFRIIVASPPYQCIATSGSWDGILADWTWMEHHLFPLAAEHGVEAVVIAVKALMDADDLTTAEALPQLERTVLARLEASDDDAPSLLMTPPVDEATVAMWNSQFDDALAALDGHAADSPREAFTLAQVYMLQALRSGDPETGKAAIKLMADAAKAGEAFAKDAAAIEARAAALIQQAADEGRQIDDGSPERFALVAAVGFEARIVAATARLNQALLLTRASSKTGAAFQLRKGWKAFSACLDEIEAYNAVHAVALDAGLLAAVKYGLGLFYFLLGLVRPGMGRTLLGAMGMHGDASRGIEYLSEVAAGEFLASPHAAVVMLASIVYVPSGVIPHPERLIMADGLIQKNMARFPGGTVFAMLNAGLKRKQGAAAEAVSTISAAIESVSASGAAVPPHYTLELAESLLFAGEAARAAEALGPLVASVLPFENRGFATLMLAAALAASGDNAGADATLATVAAACDKSSPYDAAALSLSAWYVAHPGNLALLAPELQYVKQHFYTLAPDAATAVVASLASAEASLPMADPVTAYKLNLIRGVLLTTAAAYDEANAAFDTAAAFEGALVEAGIETRLVSYMAYERTRTAFAAGDNARLAACTDALAATKPWKGDESLVRRVETSLAELSGRADA